jgi:hypothetical protein
MSCTQWPKVNIYLLAAFAFAFAAAFALGKAVMLITRIRTYTRTPKPLKTVVHVCSQAPSNATVLNSWLVGSQVTDIVFRQEKMQWVWNKTYKYVSGGVFVVN